MSKMDWLNPAAVKPSDKGVERASTSGPNPIAGVVVASWHKVQAGENGALKIDVANEDQAKMVTGFVRRDARENNLGVSVQYRNGRGELVKDMAKAKSVHFCAKQRSARAYTVVEIKEWAAANGYGEISGRVPPEVRTAFKVANGYAEDESGEGENTAENVTAQ